MESKNDRLFYAVVLVIAAVVTVGMIRWLDSGEPYPPLWVQAVLVVLGYLFFGFRLLKWVGFRSLIALCVGAYTGYQLALLLTWHPPQWLSLIGGLIFSVFNITFTSHKDDNDHKSVWSGFWFLASGIVGYLITVGTGNSQFIFGTLIGAVVMHSYVWLIQKYFQSRGLLSKSH